MSEEKKELPVIPLLPTQQARLGMLTLEIKNAEAKRSILLVTILECRGISEADGAKYTVSPDGAALIPLPSAPASPMGGVAPIQPHEAQPKPGPSPFATSLPQSEPDLDSETRQ